MDTSRNTNINPVQFWPDIDLYFKGNMDDAFTLVDHLKDSGVEYIKGAILHNPNICLMTDTKVQYHDPVNGVISDSYRTVIERHVLSIDNSAALYSYVKKQGLKCLLTVYDFEGADFAKDIGAAYIKIASSNIVHQPLIEYVSRMGLPIVIDTGLSTLEEIARAINWANDVGAKNIIIQHSPAAPPASLEAQNLQMLTTLRSTFHYPVGLSDHHRGEEMLYAAVALGASVLEKGVCHDNTPIDIDIAHALPLSRVKEVLEKCNNIAMALGTGTRELARNRIKPIARMGCIAKKDIYQGDTISLSTVDFAFPAIGIPVENWSLINGWRINRDICAGNVIGWSDVQHQD